RGFTGSIPAHQRDFLAALRRRRESVNDLVTAITLHDILKFQSVASGWALLLESNVGPLDVRARQFLGLQPLHFLLTGSHLTGPSTRRKTRDELIQLGDLLLPLRIFSFYSRPDLRFL